MKIVHAIWERRNLGMDAWEIVLERSDLNAIGKVMSKLADERYAGAYVCVKVPMGNVAVIHTLEDAGFRFLEMQHLLIQSLQPAEMLSEAPTEMPCCETRQVPKVREQWEAVISQITPGMFDTDRFALDPAFGMEVSCRRYQNWCRDLYEDENTALFVTICDGRQVAFSIDRTKNGRTQGVLGGVFAPYKNIGLGGGWMAAGAPHEMRKRRTVVSSNNLPVLRLHQCCGMTIFNEFYVLRKIYERKVV